MNKAKLCTSAVDLVSQDQNGEIANLFVGQQGVKFDATFLKTATVHCIYDKDYRINHREVVFPYLTSWNIGQNYLNVSLFKMW